MTTELFLENVAFAFFYTTGDYLVLLMAGFLLVVIFACLFSYLTED